MTSCAGPIYTLRRLAAASSLVAARVVRLYPGEATAAAALATTIGVTQVVVANGFQVCVELVDQRHAIGDVQAHNVAVEMLSRYFTRARMELPWGSDHDPLARSDGGSDFLVPVGSTRATVSFRHSVSGICSAGRPA